MLGSRTALAYCGNETNNNKIKNDTISSIVKLNGDGESPDNCDPSYPFVCIPPPPPILSCLDINQRNFVVIGNDPHNFDNDNEGIGCEI